MQLFGKLLKNLNLEVICFIFDINNYSQINYKEFQKNFENCKGKAFKIPDILKDLLKDINNKDL